MRGIEVGKMMPSKRAFRDGICLVPYDRLVEACLDLLDHPEKRQAALAANGFAAFTAARSQVSMLQEAASQPLKAQS